MKLFTRIGTFLTACWICCFLCATACAAETTLRVGYFPNITHAHALVAQSMTADGEGWFEQRLPGVRLEWVAFNAGPSAMEALFAGTVDLSYVGPSPALNAHIRSRGGDVRVISGAVRGGAALLVPKGSPLKEPHDFAEKRIATPQLGNTQDIACRYWLIQAGLRVTMSGGDVTIVPTPNSSMLGLFVNGDVDAAWTVEPWVSRLEMETGAQIIHTEPLESSVTTILVSGEKILTRQPEYIRAFNQAHQELTAWILAHPEEAERRVAEQLTRLLKREFPAALVSRAWPRLAFDNAISTDDFAASVQAAQSAGFMRGNVNIDKLVVQP